MRGDRNDLDNQLPADDNAANIRLSHVKVMESAEVSPDVVFDYDAESHIVGIEILDACAQLPKDALTKAA